MQNIIRQSTMRNIRQVAIAKCLAEGQTNQSAEYHAKYQVKSDELLAVQQKNELLAVQQKNELLAVQ